MSKFGWFGVILVLLSLAACRTAPPAPPPAPTPPPKPEQWVAVDLVATDENGVPLPLERQVALQLTLESILHSQLKTDELRQVTLRLDGTTLESAEFRPVHLKGTCSLFVGNQPLDIPAEPINADWKGWLYATQPLGMHGVLSGEWFEFDQAGKCRKTAVNQDAFRIELGASSRRLNPELWAPPGVAFRSYVGGVEFSPDVLAPRAKMLFSGTVSTTNCDKVPGRCPAPPPTPAPAPASPQ